MAATHKALLKLADRRLSAFTIQGIANDKGLGDAARALADDGAHAEQVIKMTAEQATFLERLNPCSAERHVESERPGSCCPRTAS
jgi:hypothetical protein